MYSSPSSSAAQRGFVLALTLWILAAIAIMAGYFAERARAVLQTVGSQQGEADALLSMSDARAEVLYRFLTTPMTTYGLGIGETAIRMDDHAYAYDADTTVRIQDDRGLLNINAIGDDTLVHLLQVYGVPVEQQPGLIDKLRDYVDEDDFVRLNGAEVDQYREAGLLPPRNKPLISPQELNRVLGWRDLPAIADNRQLLDQIAVKGAGFNPNTATRDVLLTLPGMTPIGAAAIIAQRNIQPLQGGADMVAIAQLPGDAVGMLSMPFPADSFRITLASRHVNWMLRYNVSLTPFGDKAPWQVDFGLRMPLPPAPPVAADKPLPITPLPPRVDVPIDLSSPLPTTH
jgi:type II secretory pathway component PulK